MMMKLVALRDNCWNYDQLQNLKVFVVSYLYVGSTVAPVMISIAVKQKLWMSREIVFSDCLIGSYSIKNSVY